MLVSSSVEGFVGALHDSLRADVDPRTGGHLAEDHQSGALEFVELFPVGKMADQIRVRDEDAGRVFVSLEHSYWLAGLHEQRLVVLQRLERADDGVIAIPVARGFACSAVNDQVLRTLANFLRSEEHTS